jgi:S-adenosylmethionine decarboxylase
MPGINDETDLELFEGVEKRIELIFNNDTLFTASLRSMSEEDITDILDAAKCSALVKNTRNRFDAYILSESSLFVYDHKIIMLTCGTTSLLLSIPVITQKASMLGLTCTVCQFTRGDYAFPDKQMYPHTSFEEECYYLNNNVSELAHKFVSNNNKLKVFSNSKYIWQTHDNEYDIIKYNKIVYFKISLGPHYINDIRMALHKYIDSYDDYVFTPCGYSLNAYKDSGYITIHVTPQSNCSYVSIESYNIDGINNQAFHDKIYNVFHYPNIKIAEYKPMIHYTNMQKKLISKNLLLVKSY